MLWTFPSYMSKPLRARERSLKMYFIFYFLKEWISLNNLSEAIMEDEYASWLWIPSPWEHHVRSRKTLIEHTVGCNVFSFFYHKLQRITKFTFGSLPIFLVDLMRKVFFCFLFFIVFCFVFFLRQLTEVAFPPKSCIPPEKNNWDTAPPRRSYKS